ncbi:hypothetical protein D9M72_460500 [compost metagenome]
MLVDAVAEAHDLLLLRQGILHPGLGPGGGVLQGFLGAYADLIEGVHDCFIGAAMERTLEGTDGSGHGRMQV